MFADAAETGWMAEARRLSLGTGASLLLLLMLQTCLSAPVVEAPNATDVDQTECVPECEGLQCGLDGCGGTCGSCDVGQECCTVNGENICFTTCPTVEPKECQSDNDCAGSQVCCDDGQGGTTCIVQCPTVESEGCQSDLDCSDGMKCCPATIPMTPSSCAAECGGGVASTCSSNADCVGGQTCKDTSGMVLLCISECADDSNCDGAICKNLGALGVSLAKVCECTADTDCPDPALRCCTVDVLGFISVVTCLTEGIDVGSLIGGLGM